MNKSSNTNSTDVPYEFMNPSSSVFQQFWTAQRARIQARIATYKVQAIEAQIEQLRLEIVLARYRGNEAALQDKTTDVQMLNLEITEKFYQVEHLKEELVNARRTQEQCTSIFEDTMAAIPNEKLFDEEIAKLLPFSLGSKVKEGEKLFRELASIGLEVSELSKDEPGRAFEEMRKLHTETLLKIYQARAKA